MKRRLLLTFIVTGLLIASVVYLTFCSKYLRINEIKIEGGERARLPTVKSLADTYLGSNILTVSLNTLNRSLINLPWIKRVKITKELPSTLIIKIDEREPYTLVELPDRGYFWAGKEGYILERRDLDPQELPHQKPVVSGVHTVDTRQGERLESEEHISLIRELMAMEDEFLKRFEQLKLEDKQARLVAVQGYKVLLKKINFKRNLNILKKILEKIDGSKYRYIDLRFDNQVIFSPRNH